MNKQSNNMAGKQSGIVLVVALLIIFIMSIIILATAKQTLLEQHITGRYGQYQVAFEAAESGLRQGQEEAISLSGNLNQFNQNARGLYGVTAAPNERHVGFWSSQRNSVIYGRSINSSDGQNITPRYTIQLMQVIAGGTASLVKTIENYGSQRSTAPGAALFKITAYGPMQGGYGVILRSYYLVALSYAPSWTTSTQPLSGNNGNNGQKGNSQGEGDEG